MGTKIVFLGTRIQNEMNFDERCYTKKMGVEDAELDQEHAISTHRGMDKKKNQRIFQAK